MVHRYEYYQEFSPEGTLKMIEYALETITSTIPIAILRTKNGIFISAKKEHFEKLEVPVNRTIVRINECTFLGITGVKHDVDNIIMDIREAEKEKTYELGFPVTCDILSRSMADSNQKYIMKSGERPYGFSMFLFGFVDGQPRVYHTDTSATLYSFYALGIGKNSLKMNKYFEKNYNEDLNDENALMLCVNALSESIGSDFSPDSVCVGVLREKDIEWLSVEQIDMLMQKISEIE